MSSSCQNENGNRNPKSNKDCRRHFSVMFYVIENSVRGMTPGTGGRFSLVGRGCCIEHVFGRGFCLLTDLLELDKGVPPPLRVAPA